MSIDTLREFDRLVGSMFPTRQALRQMPMDLYKEGEHYVLSADLPGVDPSSIDVDVDGRQLTIRATRNFDEMSDTKWIIQERSAGAFVRQLNLGEAIDTEAISANYDNGVLTVTMPVRESAKPRKVSVAHSKTEDLAKSIEA
ncbi:MAG: Hsp20/alpha crystallin family protein [Microbacteriaceae bacterium]|nr:Hsp20/alpha crystallin family protein [Microbacteriaceae bacterium]